MRRTAPLILGAGPAGCAAAIALAREGAEPVLLDRDAEPRDQLCGGFLSWRTAARLRQLGADPAQLGAHPVRTLALFEGGREVALRLPGTAYGLSRRALDHALRQRAVALGTRVEVGAARSIEGATVVGRDRTWQGESLFLATGKHDVRGLARPRNASDPALGLRLRLPADPARSAIIAGRIELHLFDGGYAGIVQQEDGTANVCLALRKSRLAKAGGEPAQLLAHLARAHPAFARRLGNDWPGADIETVGAVPYGWIARTSQPGLFRLGDQATVIPSLAGEGIAIALASGEAAARHWLAAGAAGAGAYQHEMAARSRPAVRTAALAWHLGERPALARPALALAACFPPLLQAIMHLTRLPAEAPLARGAPAS